MKRSPTHARSQRVARARHRFSYANVMSTIAVLVALAGGGAAYAAATIGSGDVINNSLRSVDVRDDSSDNGGLKSEDIAADALAANDLGPNSVGRTELDPLAFSATDIASAGGSGPFAIPLDAIQGSEVSDNTLTGDNVSEISLSPLDGHDSYDGECDPGSLTFIVCDELSFTLGRAMEVSAAWSYGFGTDGGVPPIGICYTTLNGNNKSGQFVLQSEDDSDFNIGGKPVLDVMSLPAGTHTIGFECNEQAPDNSDIVISDLYMSVVELGFD
jgi:hypothetical protein